jgi:hypothetical protein
MAVVVPFLTAVGYFVSSLCGKRLPAGFLWIGFPMEGNKLLRVGLFSIDSNDRGRHLKWSVSLEVRTSRRTISVMLPIPVQYFDEYEMEAMPRDDIQANYNDSAAATTTYDNPLTDNVDLNQPTTMTDTPNGMSPDQIGADSVTSGGSIRHNTDRKAIRLLL